MWVKSRSSPFAVFPVAFSGPTCWVFSLFFRRQPTTGLASVLMADDFQVPFPRIVNAAFLYSESSKY
ncbi:hypothetical protein SLA2020_217730 [Shorea laevis]